MALKDIAVHLDTSPRSQTRLEVAANLARDHGAPAGRGIVVRVPLTQEQIAFRLEGQYPDGEQARRAAFERDKALLRDLGVPIESEVLSGADAGRTGYRIDRRRYELADLHLTDDERARIDGQCAAAGKSLTQVLEQATTVLSGLAHCAGLVLAPKSEAALKHIEFVSVAAGKALVVLVGDDGGRHPPEPEAQAEQVEQRLEEPPVD